MRTTYNVRTGVTQIKSTGKKLSNRFALGVVAAFAVIGGALIPAASAASSGYCTASENGCTQSGSQLSGNCAGHGAFGASMKWVSADAREDGGMGHETGPANSNLCGNPQN